MVWLNNQSLKAKVFGFFGMLFLVYALSTTYNFYLLNQFKGTAGLSDLVARSIFSTRSEERRGG